MNPQVLQVTQITLSLAATTGMNFKTACPSPPLRPLHRHPFIRQNPIYSVVLPTADAEEKHTSYTLSFMVKSICARPGPNSPDPLTRRPGKHTEGQRTEAGLQPGRRPSCGHAISHANTGTLVQT